MSRFDEKINRYNTGSIKYDFAARFGKPEGLLPLWVADMDFSAADGIREALRKKADYGIFGYSDAQDGYYAALASWFLRKHDYTVKQEEVIKTPGVVFALSAAVRAFTEEGDAVIIQQPVYPPFANCVTDNKRELVNNELRCENGRYEMDLEDFEQKIMEKQVKLFILCSPHNPVGRVWTREELQRVGEICLKHHVLVVSDEIHCDFTWEENKHHVFAGLSEEFADNSIICTAPSKTFNMAGLQVSNIFVREEEKRNRLKREIYLTGYDELNVFALTGCQAAYESGGDWLEELKTYLWGNICFVRDFAEKNIKEIQIGKPEGTYLLWLDFTALHLTKEEIKELVEEAGLWLNEGITFGEKSGQFQRLNTAYPRSVLEQAMGQLKEAVDRRVGR